MKNNTKYRIKNAECFIRYCQEHLCVELDKEALLKTNDSGQIGIDVGLKEFYLDSNGDTVANPRILRHLTRKLVREQRWLSRKMPKSINRDKARIRVTRVHECISNICRDFLYKTSTALVGRNKTIAIEHLQIKNMMKNHKLARVISDVSWSELFRQLKHKAELHSSEVLKIDTFYPSSQTCSECGYRNSEIKNLSVREWTYPNCNTHHGRDTNAAINILNEGLRLSTA